MVGVDDFDVLAEAVVAWVVVEPVPVDLLVVEVWADVWAEVVADVVAEIAAEVDVGGLVGTVGAVAASVPETLLDDELVNPERTDEATTAELLTMDAVSDAPVELEFASDESAALAETSGSTVVVVVVAVLDEELVAGVLDAA